MQQTRRDPHAIVALVAEGDATAVVHEGRVLHEVPHPDPRGAEAEVDLLAVAAAERLLVEQTAEIERGARDVHAEPDPGDDLGTGPDPVADQEAGALVDAGLVPFEVELVDHRSGQRADRAPSSSAG